MSGEIIGVTVVPVPAEKRESLAALRRFFGSEFRVESARGETGSVYLAIVNEASGQVLLVDGRTALASMSFNVLEQLRETRMQIELGKGKLGQS